MRLSRRIHGTSIGDGDPKGRSIGQLAVWLLLLVLIAAPVHAAPDLASESDYVMSSPTALAAQDTGDEDKALVEFTLPDLEAVDHLVALDADLAEYLRQNEDGTVTVNAFVTPAERAYYESLGYRAGATIEDRSTWEAARAEREAVIAAEQRAQDAAQKGAEAAPAKPLYTFGFDPGGEVTIMRVDYFENYAGRFLVGLRADQARARPRAARAWPWPGRRQAATTAPRRRCRSTGTPASTCTTASSSASAPSARRPRCRPWSALRPAQAGSPRGP